MSRIVLEGTDNTRDLGGIKTNNNRIVNSNLLYRSDRLDKLTENDKQKLIDLGIKRIIDFRSETEKEKSPNNLPNGIEYVELEIESDKNVNHNLNECLKDNSEEGQRKIKNFLVDANKEFINSMAPKFGEFLRLLLDNTPTLFHCSAGKDRTGFAAFLIYTILGVPRKVILEDYMKSNDYINETIDTVKISVAKLLNVPTEKCDNLLPLLLVDLDYINSAINEAESKYGSIENYILNVLNFDLNMQNDFCNYYSKSL